MLTSTRKHFLLLQSPTSQLPLSSTHWDLQVVTMRDLAALSGKVFRLWYISTFCSAEPEISLVISCNNCQRKTRIFFLLGKQNKYLKRTLYKILKEFISHLIVFTKLVNGISCTQLKVWENLKMKLNQKKKLQVGLWMRKEYRGHYMLSLLTL